MADPRPFLCGVILAAGGATRMGRPKQLLPLDGRPLLQHALDAALAARLDEVVLVLGAWADDVARALRLPDARVRVVTNAAWQSGQASSLRAGLGAASARAAAAAVLLGDQPRVTAALIDRLAAVFLAGEAPIVRPFYTPAGAPDDAPRPVPGHPVFLARSVWADLERLDGDAGARALVAARPDLLHAVPIVGEPPADVDTWSDYRRVAGGATRALTESG